MVWNNVAKPSGTAYTNLNVQGKEQYDQADITYDSPMTFYDGTNLGQWNNVGRYLGTELVTNGSFSGSASGWTLGSGWTYSSNSVSFVAFSPELLTNGSFTGSAAGWTLGSPIWSYSSNTVICAPSSSFSNQLSQGGLAIIGGNLYRIVFTLSNINGTGNQQLLISLGSAFPTFSSNINPATAQTYTIDMSASSSNTSIFFGPKPNFSNPPNFGGTVDNISLKQNNLGTTLSQNVGATSGRSYFTSATLSGTTGYVLVDLGGINYTVFAGTSGSKNLVAGSSTVTLTPSSDFNGAVSMVSVRDGTNTWTNVAKPT